MAVSPAETKRLVDKTQLLLRAAGDKVYNSAKPRVLLDILQALVVLEMPVDLMDRRARQLQAALVHDRCVLLRGQTGAC